MSVNEIIQELLKLTPEDRNLLRQELDERYVENFEETPEILAAVDEGLRSLREEPTITIEEIKEPRRKQRGIGRQYQNITLRRKRRGINPKRLREEMKTWNFKSP